MAIAEQFSGFDTPDEEDEISSVGEGNEEGDADSATSSDDEGGEEGGEAGGGGEQI